MAEYKLYLSEAGTAARRPEEGTELELELVDNSTLERLNVKAVLSSSPQELPQCDRVWLYSKGGIRPLDDEPWAVKILEVVEDEPSDVLNPPQQQVSLGRMRGGMLEALIRRREEAGAEDKESRK